MSNSLYTLIREPEIPSDQPPVAFLLHGYGSNEEDLFSFASELPAELMIFSLRAPYSLMPYGYAWYAIHFDNPQGKWNDEAQALSSRDLIADFIKEKVEEFNLDPNRITLIGFSQGAILGYAVSISFPGLVKNLVALSGYVNPNLISLPENKDTLRHLDVYSSHGSADQIIPVSWARRNPEFLNEWGISHTYEEFPVGHGVAPQNFYSFQKWLQKRL